jgi:hypothetical protein
MGEFARLAAEPSEHQKALWWDFIAIKDEPMLSDSGALVWMGWCPLCDEVRSDDRITARFDFRRGLLYCDANEETTGRACFEQRSMSLSNVLARMGHQSGQR